MKPARCICLGRAAGGRAGTVTAPAWVALAISLSSEVCD